MTDRKAIEVRIAELRGELARVEGTPTEVYSRIVGYYRSVRNWNAGKREEYGERLVFDMPAADSLRESAERADSAAVKVEHAAPSRQAPAAAAKAESAVPATLTAPSAVDLRDGVLVFTRGACPNCPPVANYVLSSGMKAVFVDVDGDEGFALARDYGVMATPTVLALDGEGREAYRAFDVASLRSRFAEGPRSQVGISASAGER